MGTTLLHLLPHPTFLGGGVLMGTTLLHLLPDTSPSRWCANPPSLHQVVFSWVPLYFTYYLKLWKMLRMVSSRIILISTIPLFRSQEILVPDWLITSHVT
eukprot:sb/3478697/